MKCKHCDGVGFFENGASQFKCVYCDGTGEVEQTEQEYIQTCTTEQLVSFLLWYPNNVHGYPKPKMSIAEEENVIREWLKQPHHEKE